MALQYRRLFSRDRKASHAHRFSVNPHIAVQCFVTKAKAKWQINENCFHADVCVNHDLAHLFVPSRFNTNIIQQSPIFCNRGLELFLICCTESLRHVNRNAVSYRLILMVIPLTLCPCIPGRRRCPLRRDRETLIMSTLV